MWQYERDFLHEMNFYDDYSYNVSAIVSQKVKKENQQTKQLGHRAKKV